MENSSKPKRAVRSSGQKTCPDPYEILSHRVSLDLRLLRISAGSRAPGKK